MRQMKKIGFIGLGLMGGPMAANVARAGYALTVFNRTKDKSQPLANLGAFVAKNPRQVAEKSDVIITMLADATAVKAVLQGEGGLIAGAKSGQVLIDMSTVAPQETRALAEMVGGAGMRMLDAPVFGSTGPASDGTLGIMVGGPKHVFDAQHELLCTMGSHIFYMGPSGSGALVKLCFNLMVAAQIETLAEAMALAAKGGLDLTLVGEVITSSGINSNLIERKIKRIAAGEYPPAFPLRHMNKDLGLMIDTARQLGLALPATAVNHQLFNAAMARGHADEDFAAIFTLLAEMAGLGG
jgi:3-hydroxyisobutyrate dehydrogenase-like beta-hydroxyacid dehydrogenase